MSKRTAFPHRKQTRRGVVIICVLACLIVASSLAVTAIQAALRSRREAKTIQRVAQAEFLLDAGVALALEQLRNDEEYPGETWRVDSEELKGREGLVQIEVDAKSRKVRVTAKLVEATSNESATENPAAVIKRSHEFQAPQSRTSLEQ